LLLQGQDQPHEMRDRQDLEQSANRLVGLSQRRDHLLMELEAREKYQSHPSWIPGEPFETWRHRLASEKLASEVYRQQDATRSVGEAQYPAQASESGQPRA